MTTFGEIVEPVTRTAWEDWDDVTPNHEIPELKWQNDVVFPDEDINTFMVFEGKFLGDCIRSQTHNLELINAIPEVHLLLYKSKIEVSQQIRTKVPDKYICTVKDYNLLLSSEIVELLRQYLTLSNNVVVVQTKPLAEYQAMDTFSEDCVIRSISTSKSVDLDLKFPKLEQPNIISGVSAGVITLREHLDAPGIALVCYMEYPEDYQVKEMEKLLERLNITQNVQSRPSSVLSSNLYI